MLAIVRLVRPVAVMVVKTSYAYSWQFRQP